MGDTDRSVTKADHYRHPDGTVEVVYALEDGAVLTFREYPSEGAFQAQVEDAEYLGEHPGVAELPGPAGEADSDADTDAHDDTDTNET